MAKQLRTLFPSQARTATSTVEVQDALHKGILITIDVSAYPAAASVVFTLERIDPISLASEILLTAAAITATGTTTLELWPGATAVANLAANEHLPLNLNVVATHADGDSITYSVSAVLVD